MLLGETSARGTGCCRCSFILFSCKLLKDTYIRRLEHEREYQTLQRDMHLKSLICHFFVMLSRVVYPLLGIAFFQRGYASVPTLEKVDREFVEATKPTVLIITYTLIVVGFLLDALCLWKRELAVVLFYYEMVSLVNQSLIPFDFGNFGELVLLMVMVQHLITVGCDLASNTVAAAVTTTIIMLVSFPLV